MNIKGRVVSGLGDAKGFVPKYSDLIFEAIEARVYAGTLNLELVEKVDFSLFKRSRIAGPEGLGDITVYTAKILLGNGYKVWIVKADKSTHAGNIIEILADCSLREKFNLADGSLVEIGLVNV